MHCTNAVDNILEREVYVYRGGEGEVEEGRITYFPCVTSGGEEGISCTPIGPALRFILCTMLCTCTGTVLFLHCNCTGTIPLLFFSCAGTVHFMYVLYFQWNLLCKRCLTILFENFVFLTLGKASENKTVFFRTKLCPKPWLHEG